MRVSEGRPWDHPVKSTIARTTRLMRIHMRVYRVSYRLEAGLMHSFVGCPPQKQSRGNGGLTLYISWTYAESFPALFRPVSMRLPALPALRSLPVAAHIRANKKESFVSSYRRKPGRSGHRICKKVGPTAAPNERIILAGLRMHGSRPIPGSVPVHDARILDAHFVPAAAVAIYRERDSMTSGAVRIREYAGQKVYPNRYRESATCANMGRRTHTPE